MPRKDSMYFIRLVDTYLTAFIYKWRHWRWRKSGFWILTTINSIYLNTAIQHRENKPCHAKQTSKIAPLSVFISDAITIQSTFSLQITFNRNSILHGPAFKLSLLKTNNSIQIMQMLLEEGVFVSSNFKLLV